MGGCTWDYKKTECLVHVWMDYLENDCVCVKQGTLTLINLSLEALIQQSEVTLQDLPVK